MAKPVSEMTDQELVEYYTELNKPAVAAKAETNVKKMSDAELEKIADKDRPQRPDMGNIFSGAEQKGHKSLDRWTTSRILNAATDMAAAGRSIGDINYMTAHWLAKQAGASEKWQDYIGTATRLVSTLPFMALNLAPTGEEHREAIKKVTGFQEQGADDVLGIEGSGRIIDKATEAGIGALLTPAGSAQSIVRNVVPSVVAGGLSEGVGNVEGIKGTPWEMPFRLGTGLLGGVGAGVAQNLGGNVVRGIRNLAGSDVDAKQIGARIVGRAVERDRSIARAGEQMTFPELAARHAEFPEGTPLVAAGGSNVKGTTRGAYTPPGPARDIIQKGADDYIQGADARVDKVLDRISTAPSVPVQIENLRQEAAKAGPLYKAAGVPDDPQVILARKPGQMTPTPSAILGPDGQPVIVMKPGPDVTSVSSAGLKLTSPEVATFMGESGYAKEAINKVRKLSGYKDLPVNDMVMVDKVYKHLGDLETDAVVRQAGTEANELGRERQKLLDLITRENPAYADALKAHGDPASRAKAVLAGRDAAGKNVRPDELSHTYSRLKTDQEKADFKGGYTDALRGQTDATKRATAAERIWNSDTQIEKVNRLVTPTPEGPVDTFRGINRDLENEKTAARALREVTQGSQTGRVLSELADNAGVDVGSLISDMSKRGVLKTFLERILNSKMGEGRTGAVNEEIARMMMETRPAEIQRNASMIERARQAAQQTAAARQAAVTVPAAQGLLSADSAASAQQKPPGPADRLINGLLGNF